MQSAHKWMIPVFPVLVSQAVLVIMISDCMAISMMILCVIIVILILLILELNRFLKAYNDA